MKNANGKFQPKEKSQYIVEFSAVATYVIDFEDAAGLTERQIIAKAQELAKGPFQNNGGLSLEFSAGQCTHALVALGFEPSSAHISGKPLPEKPQLRLVKG